MAESLVLEQTKTNIDGWVISPLLVSKFSLQLILTSNLEPVEENTDFGSSYSVCHITISSERIYSVVKDLIQSS